MSYILDALKKSARERQQGTSPHLHSTHGPIIPSGGRSSSAFKQYRISWLVAGCVLLLVSFLGILFFRDYHVVGNDPEKVPEAVLRSTNPQTAGPTSSIQPANSVTEDNGTTSPRVTVKEKNKAVLSIPAKTGASEPQAALEKQSPHSSLPLLQELPEALQADIPILKFAGHTYSKNPSQRMIIINGKILREGDLIAPGTYLTEITWEGVTVSFKGSRFRLKTNE
jgi:general secretion pathway protein B